MEAILILFLAYRLHVLSIKKGQKPLPWILRFVLCWLGTMVMVGIVVVSIMGEKAIEAAKDPSSMAFLVPIMLFLDLCIFFYFRARLMSFPDGGLPVEPDEPEETEEKDLSYFR